MPHSVSASDHSDNDSLPPRRGVYLLTHPRSASNLFQTMMAKQRSYGKDVQGSSYHFFDAAYPTLFAMDKGSLEGPNWTDAEREALNDPYKAAYKKLNEELASAEEKGQQVFIKEHAFLLRSPDELYASVFGDTPCNEERLVLRREGETKRPANTNPTYLPDHFLLAMQPVFQIRHPVLMFPSLLRTQAKAMPGSLPSRPMIQAMLALDVNRALFDWYRNHPTALSPKVIDADDIMKDREAVRQLCVEIDFDPDSVQYEWETREEKDPMRAAFLSTINASSGIKPGLQARGLDVETEKVKWVEEFGEQGGEDLAKAVYAAMPDYEYLLKHNVKGAQ